MDKYTNRIIAIIVERSGVDPEDVSINSFFADDLNIDELELFEIISILEDEYQIELDEEEKDGIETIKDLISVVVEKLE